MIEQNRCLDCDKPIGKKSKRCGSCSHKGKRNSMYGRHDSGFSGRKHKKESLSKMSNTIKSMYDSGIKMGFRSMTKEENIDAAKKAENPWKGKSLTRFIGENNRNWKGGVTPLRFRIRESIKYKEWRIDVFKRDNYICQECGSKIKIQAHHIKSFSEIMDESDITSFDDAMKHEELWDVDNGQTLCIECHKKTY